MSDQHLTSAEQQALFSSTGAALPGMLTRTGASL
jgi:hypothetical protein